ncbi:hypothetical protein BS47DRAFT_1341999 [Hydnum rufescens UP504]|uniref:Uncharacterized protein n=1 Tax=Hydnum rufescens UP504 TaxID=1448309 RepID=A0A9P6B1J7_9AGAM|nr:hypothetical protein BS47DRAFT_1341999 [Hydnum rufescens UP504]
MSDILIKLGRLRFPLPPLQILKSTAENPPARISEPNKSPSSKNAVPPVTVNFPSRERRNTK